MPSCHRKGDRYYGAKASKKSISRAIIKHSKAHHITTQHSKAHTVQHSRARHITVQHSRVHTSKAKKNREKQSKTQ